MQRLNPLSCGVSILAASLGLALVGCGGSNSSGTPPASTSSDPPGTSTPTATAPTITTQPSSQTVTAGLTATFTVVASGSGTLTYQWQDGGTNIAGATGASYTTPATTAQNSGSSYQVVVSNSAGSVTSSAAKLTVTAAPASSCTAAPAAPTGLAAALSAGSVSLSWAAVTAPSNCAISSYNIYRGTTTGFTPSASNLLGSTTTAITYTDSTPPPATYYYRR